MSTKSAGQAVNSGYKNIRVMLAGEPAWAKAGYPVYANYGYICHGNNVLIDLRSTKKDAESRIPRSINIPFAALEDKIDDIPIRAPIVLYSDNEQESIAALKIFRKEGYKKVSLVEGGYQGWKKLGGKLIKGPVVTDIHWQRKLAEGEITLAEFNNALKDPTKAIILDVRTNDEVAAGKLKQSLHIPLDELCSHMDDFFSAIEGISKSRKVYVHCTTGARAEMAYKELKKNGYNAYYLVAEVECEGDDCTIEE